jgi:methylmalonyl-CoA mutase
MPDSGFAPVTLAQWTAAVAADLGPDALERRLATVTEDGIALDALHTPENAGAGAGVGQAVALLLAEARRAAGRDGWGVRQRLDGASATLAELGDELAGGADAVELDLGRIAPLGVPARVAALAEPVARAGAELALHGLRDAAALAAHFRPSGAVALGMDPLGTWVGQGAVGSPHLALDGLLGLAPWWERGVEGTLLRASAEPWHDAGCTAAWSVALAAGTALEYVRRLATVGIEPAVSARALELVLPLSAELFEGIATLRAVRLVWARVLEELGASAVRPVRVVALYGRRGLARRDPWTNPLRETIAAVAAATGGADVLQLPPFDVRRHEATPAARRLARATSLILREEGGLHRVADPAGGSWFLDAFTGRLAEAAWARLGELELAGGMTAALASGLVARRIAEARVARAHAVRTRTRPLVGVGDFADPAERLAGEVRPAEAPDPRFGLHPDAEPFERLRDIADEWAHAAGRAPVVFLARLGAARESAARAAFARGVLHAGGFDAAGPDALPGPEAGGDAFRASGALAAILCGTDERYAAEAAAMASALRAAGARAVLVAGRSGADAALLRDAGVTGWVHQGADVVAALAALQAATGVHP